MENAFSGCILYPGIFAALALPWFVVVKILDFSLFIIYRNTAYGGSETFYRIEKARSSVKYCCLEVGTFLPMSRNIQEIPQYRKCAYFFHANQFFGLLDDQFDPKLGQCIEINDIQCRKEGIFEILIFSCFLAVFRPFFGRFQEKRPKNGLKTAKKQLKIKNSKIPSLRHQISFISMH